MSHFAPGTCSICGDIHDEQEREEALSETQKYLHNKPGEKTMDKWNYIIITGDGEVSGTDDEAEAKELAADCTVLKINFTPEGGVAQIDSDGDEQTIGKV